MAHLNSSTEEGAHGCVHHDGVDERNRLKSDGEERSYRGNLVSDDFVVLEKYHDDRREVKEEVGIEV